MDLNCPQFDKCSGCSLNVNIDHPMLMREAIAFFADYGISAFKLNVGAPTGWRCHAKLATGGSSENPVIGLYATGTHRVVDIPHCPVHHPSINRTVELLRGWIRSEKISLYDETTGLGWLRYVQLSVERSSGLVQLALVVNARQDRGLEDSVKTSLGGLWERGQKMLHSLWLNFNIKRDNVIFSPHWHLIYGQALLWERLCGQDVCFHPASFVQANLVMFEHLLQHVRQQLLPQTTLLEFYAGVGAIGLSVVDLCQKVCCVEIVPMGQMCFEESKCVLSKELASRLSYVCAPAASQLQLLQHPYNVVLVDPPRKGLDASLLQALCIAPHVSRLIYISCGWTSFQRDCASLIAGGWKLTQAEGFLFFPGSEHLEVLAIFDRAS